MTKRFKLAGLLAAFVLFASGSAVAVPITFNFTTLGTISGSSTVAEASGSILNISGWSFENTLLRSGNDVVSGSTWTFTDGTNSLFGTVTGLLTGQLDPFPLSGGGFLNYEITGGTGFLYGATGSGHSDVGFLFGLYSDSSGSMTLRSVPEPGTTALFAVALALIGVAAYRRRRAVPQR